MRQAGQSYQKLLNMSRLMRSIRAYPGLSRTDVAQYTGLTKSTVSNLVKDLMRRRLVCESEGTPEETATGRPPVGLEIDGRHLLIAGVELRPEGWLAAVMDIHGRRRPMGSNSGTAGENTLPAQRIPELLRSAFSAVRAAVQHDPEDFLFGIGVAMPAVVNPFEGRVLTSESFNMREVLLRDLGAVPGDIPLLLENDANALAWGALAQRNSDDLEDEHHRNLLAVTARRSSESAPRHSSSGSKTHTILRAGTGLVINGSVHYGKDFCGGEFRSVTWTDGMPGEIGGGEDALRELFASLSTPVSMLRPERVVYGGDLIRYTAELRRILEEDLAKHYIDPRVSGCPVEPAPDGEEAAAVGAAQMVRERLFALPRVDEPRPEELPHWADAPEQPESDGIHAPAGVGLVGNTGRGRP